MTCHTLSPDGHVNEVIAEARMDWHICEVENRPGNDSCLHEWKESDFVVDTFPATNHRVCKICGRVEARY